MRAAVRACVWTSKSLPVLVLRLALRVVHAQCVDVFQYGLLVLRNCGEIRQRRASGQSFRFASPVGDPFFDRLEYVARAVVMVVRGPRRLVKVAINTLIR